MGETETVVRDLEERQQWQQAVKEKYQLTQVYLRTYRSTKYNENLPGSPAAYITCGLPFSGKTTAARRVAAELGADHVRFRAIRRERGLLDQEILSAEEWRRICETAMDRVADCLANGRSVVVDDTFALRSMRDRFQELALRRGARSVILYLDTPIDVVEMRRADNSRNPIRHLVPDEIFKTLRDNFQHPQLDEPVIRIRNVAELSEWLIEESMRAAPSSKST